ncbi:hypothetical protein [Thalassotalea eurytherma]|uniref:Uncharacterized protein n=1 Tax=Thalassotalea eurytherma TaxID=1144278 RepID=A0ABQ6H8J3_9GAMM|nr:hypothetical protein [Thalassotalea eurytherma]GLX83176.1 hypothetical protein theurythT_26280 [Thalassotalea eurytherma]
MLVTSKKIFPLVCSIFIALGSSSATQRTLDSKKSVYLGSADITQGMAKTIDAIANLCTVSADNNFTKVTQAIDLYEECANITPKSHDDVDETSVPDMKGAGGEVVTGTIFVGNYFDLYINGKLKHSIPQQFTIYLV